MCLMGQALTVPGPTTIKQGSGNGLTITNSASQTGLTVNAFAGQQSSISTVTSGGTNLITVNPLGSIQGPDGSTASPAFSFLSETNMGVFRRQSGKIDVVAGGSVIAEFYSSFAPRMQGTTQIGWASGSDATAAADLVVGRDTTATFQMGTDAASPVNQAFKGPDGSGTDKNGGSMTIEGGQSTGTGRGGDLIFRTSITTNSASATNFYSTRSYQSAKFVDLTDATTNLLFKCSLAPGTYCGGAAIVTLFISNGTDFKVHTSNVSWSAVNKGGTITGQVVEAAQLENHVETAGTAIADTFTLVQDGANNTYYISVTPTQGTVITPSVYRAKWVITALNSNDPATITPP